VTAEEIVDGRVTSVDIDSLRIDLLTEAGGRHNVAGLLIAARQHTAWPAGVPKPARPGPGRPAGAPTASLHRATTFTS
jgi:hypothetical protein